VTGEEREEREEAETYQDDEFFHALLKELMMSGTAAARSGEAMLLTGPEDPIAMSQAYLRIRRLRSRQQRKEVDRRASKGRKLRFQAHEKLAVFMAPLETQYPQRSSTRTDELFKSLLGSKPKTTATGSQC
jgi:protein AATF/BFR2